MDYILMPWRKVLPILLMGIMVVCFQNCGEGYEALEALRSLNSEEQQGQDDQNSDPGSDPGADSGMVPQVPSWLNELQTGVWKAISLNNVQSVMFAARGTYPYNSTNNGFDAIMDAWNGGVFAHRVGTSGSLLIYGGGHFDYWGNDVYGFDLETRRWRLITRPYTGAINWPLPQGLFPDQTPGPIHTYNYLQYDPIENHFYVFAREYDRLGGNTSPYVSFLNLNEPQLPTRANWTNLPTSVNTGAGLGGSSCYDSEGRAFWVLTNDRFVRIDLTTKTSQRFTLNEDNSYYSTADCAKGLYVYISQGTNSIRALDLANPTQRSVVLASTQVIGNSGFAWSNRRQSFIYWANGTGLRELKHNGDNPKFAQSWVLQDIQTSGAGLDVPSRNMNGTYGRFRVVQFADGREIAIVVNSVTGPVHAVLLP